MVYQVFSVRQSNVQLLHFCLLSLGSWSIARHYWKVWVPVGMLPLDTLRTFTSPSQPWLAYSSIYWSHHLQPIPTPRTKATKPRECQPPVQHHYLWLLTNTPLASVNKNTNNLRASCAWTMEGMLLLKSLRHTDKTPTVWADLVAQKVFWDRTWQEAEKKWIGLGTKSNLIAILVSQWHDVMIVCALEASASWPPSWYVLLRVVTSSAASALVLLLIFHMKKIWDYEK